MCKNCTDKCQGCFWLSKWNPSICGFEDDYDEAWVSRNKEGPCEHYATKAEVKSALKQVKELTVENEELAAENEELHIHKELATM